MRTPLSWIPGPWRGRLAIAPRPRGGDWLADELRQWRGVGVDTVVSLLAPNEAAELLLSDEAEICERTGLQFLPYAIEDRGVPADAGGFLKFATMLAERLTAGEYVAIHCRQGIGRASLAAICLLILGGIDEVDAVAQVGAARGVSVPETAEQRRWIAGFAKSLLAAHR